MGKGISPLGKKRFESWFPEQSLLRRLEPKASKGSDRSQKRLLANAKKFSLPFILNKKRRVKYFLEKILKINRQSKFCLPL